jgi:mono/diheme cytochrome c family protein
MKKMTLFSGKTLAATLSITLLSILSINAVTTGEQSPKPIPDDVLKIVNNSCGKCHNQGGSGAALANLNLTKWDNYNAVKQAKKAEAICRVITTEKMPPKSFIKKNPQAVISAEDRATICAWSKQ